MQWLSETCVVLRCDDLINSSYELHQIIPRQFSVLKPYQAPALIQVKTSPATEGNPILLSKQEVVADHTRAQEVASSEAEDSAPAEPGPEESHTRPVKRRRKVHSDPQAESRQGEAQQRHDARKPTLLSAYELCQHFLQAADSSRAALHTIQSAGAPLLPSCHAAEDSNMQQTDSLDLLALHELKYTLRPKFSYVSEGTHGAPVNLFDNFICNDGKQERIGDAFGHAVLIPAQAAFLLSDIRKMNPLLTGLRYTNVALNPLLTCLALYTSHALSIRPSLHVCVISAYLV